MAGITLTALAAEKIGNLCAEQAGEGLRVRIVGGGCSGLTYQMKLDEPREGDRVFQRDDARLIVDRKSFLYLQGTELDFSDSLTNSGFTLHNPNVKRSCGCGSSFSV